jgi:hypothetical protein
MFKNFVGPNPIEEIVKPRIFRREGEMIYAQTMTRNLTGVNIFAMVTVGFYLK